MKIFTLLFSLLAVLFVMDTSALNAEYSQKTLPAKAPPKSDNHIDISADYGRVDHKTGDISLFSNVELRGENVRGFADLMKINRVKDFKPKVQQNDIIVDKEVELSGSVKLFFSSQMIGGESFNKNNLDGSRGLKKVDRFWLRGDHAELSLVKGSVFVSGGVDIEADLGSYSINCYDVDKVLYKYKKEFLLAEALDGEVILIDLDLQ